MNAFFLNILFFKICFNEREREKEQKHFEQEENNLQRESLNEQIKKGFNFNFFIGVFYRCTKLDLKRNDIFVYLKKKVKIYRNETKKN